MNLKTFISKSFFILLTLTLCPSVFASNFMAGFSRKVITPTVDFIKYDKIMLGAYGLGHEAKGVADDIYARAMFLSEADGSHPLAVVILDVPGISNRIIAQIRAEASRQARIPEQNILVGATHTHYAPDLQGIWGGNPKAYIDWLVERSAWAVLEAKAIRKEAKLMVSKTQGFAHNRRDWGITDTDLVVLDAVSVDKGRRLGTLVNFGAHPTTNKDKSMISADYCGYLVKKIERKLGGAAVFVNGILGDVSPAPDPKAANPAKFYGEALADLAIKSIQNQVQVTPAKIEFGELSWQTKVNNFLFLLAQKLGRLDYDLITNPSGGFDIKSDVGLFRLGNNVQSVIFPGEALTRLGQKIKSTMNADYKLWFGLTGDTLGYFVPNDEWKSGRNKGYEESMSVNKDATNIVETVLDGMITADNQNLLYQSQ